MPSPQPSEPPLSYDESKRLMGDKDPAARARLASQDQVRPEILFYLAEDDSSDVRRQVAGNRRTPHHAHLILARDEDESVRVSLAEKVAQLLPHLDQGAQNKARQYITETLEALARDQVTQVREVLAEALKEVAQAPSTVIQRLAHDARKVVAATVLEFSPLLSHQDLIEIIEEGCASGKLQAISRRKGLASGVADAIVSTENEVAITALLQNSSAQIREETLDLLVDRAPRVTAWHEPLVKRPSLPSRAAGKLATFVADSLLKQLGDRQDLDPDTARRIASEVRQRLQDGATDRPGARPARSAPEAARLHADGQLDEAALGAALADGERDFVRAGLALRARVSEQLAEKILNSGSPRGVTALAWSAHMDMRFATQLQITLARIPPGEALEAGSGAEFPITPAQMRWQISFFKDL